MLKGEKRKAAHMKNKIVQTMLLLFLLGIGSPAFAEGEITVSIDGQELYCDVAPVLINDRTMVPMRAIFEALDSNIAWDGASQTIEAYRDGEYVQLQVGNTQMKTGIIRSDGAWTQTDTIALEAAPQIVEDRTMVPVRAVSEFLRTVVEWNGNTRTVLIDTQPESTQGMVIYTSGNDDNRLYRVDANGKGRKKLSDHTGCYGMQYDNGFIYYYTKEDNHKLYRVDTWGGQGQQVTDEAAYGICISDGYFYYLQRSSGQQQNEASGILYRVGLDGTGKQQLTAVPIRYPYYYKGRLYYNELNDDRMYLRNLDGSGQGTASLGDNITFFPFNGYFYKDYIFIENGVKYGNIYRMDLDGNNVKILNYSNSHICQNQAGDDTLTYVNADDHNSIYIMNLDGSNCHKVVDIDYTWIDVGVCGRYEDLVYYKNMLRNEIYSIRTDGSGNKKVANAVWASIKDGKLYSTMDALFVSNLDGSDKRTLYSKPVYDWKVYGQTAYCVDASTYKLYKTFSNAKERMITNEDTRNWIYVE